MTEALVAVAVLVALTGVLSLLLNLRERVRRLELATQLSSNASNQVTELTEPASDDWPETAPLQPGRAAPAALTLADGRWKLVVAIDESTIPIIEQFADEAGPEVSERYTLVCGHVGPVTHESQSMRSFTCRRLDEETHALPVPSMAMIDPDDVVRGAGNASAWVDVLHFLAEGEHQGLGPDFDVERNH